ncbi:MAG: hypothetical protein ONB32_05310 [candidate division KSB1 bacterium]|nr:hypothetical protein [candidate division KSB1 bacterium]
MISIFGQSIPTSLVEIIRQNQQQKRQFDIQDAYKLIYQSVFGIEHLLVDLEGTRQRLNQELNAIRADSDEPLIEIISVSGDVVRLNLRPYKLLEGEASELFQAMIWTGQQIRGSREGFLSLWGQFQEAVVTGLLNFDKKALLRFDEQMNARNYPAVHHSHGYRQAHRPAYRVLSRESVMTLVNVLLEKDQGNA